MALTRTPGRLTTSSRIATSLFRMTVEQPKDALPFALSSPRNRQTKPGPSTMRQQHSTALRPPPPPSQRSGNSPKVVCDVALQYHVKRNLMKRATRDNRRFGETMDERVGITNKWGSRTVCGVCVRVRNAKLTPNSFGLAAHFRGCCGTVDAFVTGNIGWRGGEKPSLRSLLS
jgi:hypothetical protein